VGAATGDAGGARRYDRAGASSADPAACVQAPGTMASLTAQFPQRKPSTASPEKPSAAAGAPPSPGPSQEASGPRMRSKEWLELRRREHMDVCNMLNLDELTRKLSWDMLYRMYQRGVGDEVRHGPFGFGTGPGPAELALSAGDAALLCDPPQPGPCAPHAVQPLRDLGGRPCQHDPGRAQERPHPGQRRHGVAAGRGLQHLVRIAQPASTAAQPRTLTPPRPGPPDRRRDGRRMENFLTAVNDFLAEDRLDILSAEQREWLQREFAQLQTLHTSMVVVFRKFHEAFTRLFAVDTPLSNDHAQVFKFCWLLFLNAQGALAPPNGRHHARERSGRADTGSASPLLRRGGMPDALLSPETYSSPKAFGLALSCIILVALQSDAPPLRPECTFVAHVAESRESRHQLSLRVVRDPYGLFGPLPQSSKCCWTRPRSWGAGRWRERTRSRTRARCTPCSGASSVRASTSTTTSTCGRRRPRSCRSCSGCCSRTARFATRSSSPSRRRRGRRSACLARRCWASPPKRWRPRRSRGPCRRCRASSAPATSLPTSCSWSGRTKCSCASRPASLTAGHSPTTGTAAPVRLRGASHRD